MRGGPIAGGVPSLKIRVTGERAAISQWVSEPPSYEAVATWKIGLRQAANF